MRIFCMAGMGGSGLILFCFRMPVEFLLLLFTKFFQFPQDAVAQPGVQVLDFIFCIVVSRLWISVGGFVFFLLGLQQFFISFPFFFLVGFQIVRSDGVDQGLQIEKKNQQIESIKQEEIMKQVSSLEKKGMDIDTILKAIDEQDLDRLLAVLNQESSDPKPEIPGQTNLEKESLL